MRDFKTLFEDLINKPPRLFPLVGLFHIIWLLLVLWGLKDVPFGRASMINLIWMAGYTVFWLAACDLRKWGATGYLLMALVNAILYLTLKSPSERIIYTSSLFLLDDIFSFFLLFFYKRFR